MGFTFSHAERTAKSLREAVQKCHRRVFRRLLALLAPCWVRDIEISSVVEKAVSGPICSASPGLAVSRFLWCISQAFLLEAHLSIAVPPMLGRWSCVSRKP